VKDAVAEIITKYKKTGDITVACEDELKYELTDVVFNALGITEDEQDMVGGYFLLHAGKREEPRRCTGCNTQLNSADKVWDGRCVDCHTKDLREGMKYSREDFQYWASKAIKRVPESKFRWHLLLETPTSSYGETYESMTWVMAVHDFVKKFYPIYEDDHETIRIKLLEQELKKEEAELAEDQVD
jgi:hypothetical protein